MSFEIPNFLPAAPEIVVLTMACVVLMVDLFLKKEQRFYTYLLSQATILLALFATLWVASDATELTFNNGYIRDSMGDWLKIFILIVTAAVFLYSRQYLKDREIDKGEYYVLGLFAMLGMMIMVSAWSFLNLYLGLELLSLSLYAMVAFDRNSAKASEAAMKYFVLGAIASGMLLYGMSILYGLTGTLNIADVHQQLNNVPEDLNIAVVFGLVFMLVGMAFKLGAVPFHMWLPDVYHGAPTSVTLFVGSAPKIAAFAMVMRLLVSGLGPLHEHWQDMLIILAVLSIGLGNIVAIAQTNIKRMLAYSTISHVGFILLGILAGSKQGYAAAMFYSIIYAFMSLGAFGLIVILSRKGFEAENLEDFKGLNDRSPWLAAMMLLILFSMAGVPPTVGFYAKLVVLQAIVHIDLVWLAVYAVLLSVIGAFYYLRVIKLMYFDKPDTEEEIKTSMDVSAVISVNGLMMLALGLFPGALMTICLAAMN